MTTNILQYYTDTVLMVAPTKFFFNTETAWDNEFMNQIEDDSDLACGNEEAQQTKVGIDFIAAQEHQNLVQKIEESGISVIKYEQQADDLPDSLFPNNWVSSHKYPNSIDEKGVVCVYPMKVPTRQREVNYDIVRHLTGDEGHTIDFTNYNHVGKALEGTGVLIFDPANRKIYAGISQRWELDVLENFLENFNQNFSSPFKLVTFTAKTATGTPIYHTNVMMSILSDHAAICLEAIQDPEERERVIQELSSPELNDYPKRIIDISLDEVYQMWGNILCVVNNKAEPWVIMSSTAFNGFSEEHLHELESHYRIIHSDVSTIEKIGGGSARCMVAEVF